MKKQRIEILDAYGKRLYVAHVEDAAKGLAGAVLEGFIAPHAKLPAMNFSKSVMYWPSLPGADLSFCDFSYASISGASLEDAILRFANFRGATFSKDSFGYVGSIAGADLTGANLTDASLIGMEYDGRTIFPDDFDPQKNGLVKVEDEAR